MTARVLRCRLSAGPEVVDSSSETTEGAGGQPTRRRVVLAMLAASALAGCKILPIAREADSAEPKFDGKEVVDKLWSSKVMPVIRDKAVPIETVLDAVAADLDAAGKTYGHRPAEEGSPWSFIVKGHAVVKEKNTASRAGTVAIEITTSKGVVPVTIQIGPVIKGNSMRDAMPFINFQNFTNQIDFAEVGRAFNTHALNEFQPVVDAIAVGKDLSFTGAFSLNAATDKILLTPAILELAGGA